MRKNKIDFKRNDAILLINAVKAVIEKIENLVPLRKAILSWLMVKKCKK